MHSDRMRFSALLFSCDEMQKSFLPCDRKDFLCLLGFLTSQDTRSLLAFDFRNIKKGEKMKNIFLMVYLVCTLSIYNGLVRSRESEI